MYRTLFFSFAFLFFATLLRIHCQPPPSPPPATKPFQTRPDSPPEAQMNSLHTGLTSVVFVGNPGIGKSTLHNALEGSFPSGFSPVQEMTVGEPQQVHCDRRYLRLVDVPGISDSSNGSGKDNVMDRNLKTLQDRLNDGHAYVIFFVLTPRNGRVDNGDLSLIKLFLEKFSRGPLVGLILTQIRQRDLAAVQHPSYLENVLSVLKRGGADLRSLRQNNALILCSHDDNFSHHDRQRVRDYILSFEPRQVQIYNMVSTAWRTIRSFFRKLFS